ncbi:MAG: hypothetical protein OSB82_02040 [Alphaproteobacteria bacterium]|jgi:hypothetical protein|nr:hypothetical protein [Alphaproteobacteria bacterium]
MEDDFKHADEYEDEIRGLIDDAVGTGLMTAMARENICPKCMALTLLEFAAYAATSSGATAGEILAAASAGAMTAEDDMDLADDTPPTQARH